MCEAQCLSPASQPESASLVLVEHMGAVLGNKRKIKESKKTLSGGCWELLGAAGLLRLRLSADAVL